MTACIQGVSFRESASDSIVGRPSNVVDQFVSGVYHCAVQTPLGEVYIPGMSFLIHGPDNPGIFAPHPLKHCMGLSNVIKAF